MTEIEIEIEDVGDEEKDENVGQGTGDNEFPNFETFDYTCSLFFKYFLYTRMKPGVACLNHSMSTSD